MGIFMTWEYDTAATDVKPGDVKTSLQYFSEVGNIKGQVSVQHHRVFFITVEQHTDTDSITAYMKHQQWLKTLLPTEGVLTFSGFGEEHASIVRSSFSA